MKEGIVYNLSLEQTQDFPRHYICRFLVNGEEVKLTSISAPLVSDGDYVLVEKNVCYNLTTGWRSKRQDKGCIVLINRISMIGSLFMLFLALQSGIFLIPTLIFGGIYFVTKRLIDQAPDIENRLFQRAKSISIEEISRANTNFQATPPKTKSARDQVLDALTEWADEGDAQSSSPRPLVTPHYNFQEQSPLQKARSTLWKIRIGCVLVVSFVIFIGILIKVFLGYMDYQTKGIFDYEAYTKIPVGINVNHNPVSPAPQKKKSGYSWQHTTIITSKKEDLRITEFGMLVKRDGHWKFVTIVDKPYNNKDFAYMFKKSEGEIKAGISYTSFNQEVTGKKVRQYFGT